jgi:hypothetical protein
LARASGSGGHTVGVKALEPPTAPVEAPDAPLELRPIFPPAVLAILEAPDAAEVMTIDPEPVEEECPGLLHGYPVRGTVRVPTPVRRRQVGQALIAANRSGHGWAACFDPHYFDPHYAVRLSRGGRGADFLICFACGNVRVVGPGEHGCTCPIGSSAARALRRELRRGGVGWMWSWRRWLARPREE